MKHEICDSKQHTICLNKTEFADKSYDEHNFL